MSVFGLHTSNPAFSTYFWGGSAPGSKKMSLTGIFIKSMFCLALVTITASYTWKLAYEGVDIKWWTSGGMLAALALSLLISFKNDWAPWLTPIYALAKGLFLGGISAYAHKRFPNLPIQAVGMTILTFFIMLTLFKTRIIRVTKKFRAVVITAAATIFTIYIVAWILGFFGIRVPMIWGTSWFAIVFNVIAAIVASLSLLLDFDYMERHIGRAPKQKEWLATWGLLITLVWLYVEILRLLKKFAIRF